MLVKHLIRELKKCPQDAEVWTRGHLEMIQATYSINSDTYRLIVRGHGRVDLCADPVGPLESTYNNGADTPWPVKKTRAYRPKSKKVRARHYATWAAKPGNLEDKAKGSREAYAHAKELGICPRAGCGCDPEPGRVHCKKHSAHNRSHKQKAKSHEPEAQKP